VRALPAFVAAALLAWTVPAAAVPVATPTRPSPVGAAPSLATVDAEQAAFGQWLARLTAVEQPVQNGLAELQRDVQSIMAASDIPRAVVAFRPTVARLLAAVDEVDARLAALDEPDFPALGIPSDLQPATLKRTMRQFNASVRAGFASYLPVLDAVARRDLAAARVASARSMTSMRQVLDFQLLLARAMQAPFPRERSVWNMIEVQVIYARAAVRLGGAWPAPGTAPMGTMLAGDLRALADDVEHTVGEGSPKIEAELAEVNAILADAEHRGDSHVAAIARRQLAMLSRGQAFFPLGSDLAALLRRMAAELGSRPLTDQRMIEAFVQLYPIRDRIIAIAGGIAANLAGGS